MNDADLLEWLDEQFMTQRDLGNAETAAMYEAAWKAVRERGEALEGVRQLKSALGYRDDLTLEQIWEETRRADDQYGAMSDALRAAGNALRLFAQFAQAGAPFVYPPTGIQTIETALAQADAAITYLPAALISGEAATPKIPDARDPIEAAFQRGLAACADLRRDQQIALNQECGRSEAAEQALTEARAEIERMRGALAVIKNHAEQPQINYDRTGPTWTSRKSGAEYEDTSTHLEFAQEIVDLCDAATLTPATPPAQKDASP